VCRQQLPQLARLHVRRQAADVHDAAPVAGLLQAAQLLGGQLLVLLLLLVPAAAAGGRGGRCGGVFIVLPVGSRRGACVALLCARALAMLLLLLLLLVCLPVATMLVLLALLLLLLLLPCVPARLVARRVSVLLLLWPPLALAAASRGRRVCGGHDGSRNLGAGHTTTMAAWNGRASWRCCCCCCLKKDLMWLWPWLSHHTCSTRGGVEHHKHHASIATTGHCDQPICYTRGAFKAATSCRCARAHVERTRAPCRRAAQPSTGVPADGCDAGSG
jgi:hypothetical protein